MDSKRQKLHHAGPMGEEEEDVLLKIGDTEFRESSHYLCYWSEYFAAAFRSGMKEATTKRFEFPHRKPEEWRRIKNVLDPFHEDRLTWTNVDAFLPFATELGIALMIDHADDIISNVFRCDGQFEDPPYYDHFCTSKLLESLKMIHQYDLKRSEPVALEYIQEYWSRNPQLFWSDNDEIFEILAENKGLCDNLWYLIEPYIPSDLKGKSRQDILGQPHRLWRRFYDDTVFGT